MCVCVCVCITNTTEKDYLTKVSYGCWLSISTDCFFLWFDEISVFEAGKSLTDKVWRGREWLQKVSLFVAVYCWKSNVKKRKSVLTLLVEIKRVSVFSLEVTQERVCWLCKWKCERVVLTLQVKLWKREWVLED